MTPIRRAIADMPPQRIGAVSKLAVGDPDIIPLWFGESDLPTPDFIGEAAIQAIRDGHTRYVHKRGILPLREAIRDYMEAQWAIPLDLERVTVTGSGMTAIMIAVEFLVDNGDNVVMPSPVWPNIFYAVETMGGECRHVRLADGPDGWRLDLEQLFAACDERTKALFIASPSNPTGWMMTTDEQRAVLAFCRERGIWIIADEVYHRIVYDRAVSPSFLEVAEPEDALFVVHSFSKSWAMTGWRLGWIVHPAALGDRFGDLSGINNTGATSFVQHAGITAIREGDDFVAEMVDYCRRGRDFIFQRLAGIDRVRISRPEAAFYAFFSIDGLEDDLKFAQDLVLQSRVGLAPGTAFGPGNEGYLRLCFASAEDKLSEALDRMEQAFS
ncbi:MAG: pyridoxal phosphate-dependent aminotransferase [Alphaproteobacteria bacterium]|jgi:aspartate/methionine/tyrosine aminotransferase|nr:pyridoxal phosphate-dependent aminotransferase [Alphaproteobacteria bacterium]